MLTSSNEHTDVSPAHGNMLEQANEPKEDTSIGSRKYYFIIVNHSNLFHNFQIIGYYLLFNST